MDAIKLVDMLFPEHDRTSCSDDDLNNGVINYNCITRCSRCAMLSLIDNPEKAKYINRDVINFLNLETKEVEDNE